MKQFKTKIYLLLIMIVFASCSKPAEPIKVSPELFHKSVDKVMEMAEGTRLYLLAPIVRGRKGEYRKEFMELLKAGFQRVKVDGEFYDIEDVPDLNKKIKHNIEVVVHVINGLPKETEEMEQKLYDYLKSLNIEFRTKYHSPIVTKEDADELASTCEGTICKVVFLKGKDNYYLYAINTSTNINMKTIHKRLGQNKAEQKRSPQSARHVLQQLIYFSHSNI